MFLRNSYPLTVCERCVNTFLQKIFQPKPVTVTVPGRPITIGLQYIRKHSLNVRAQLRRLATKFYTYVELKIDFRSARKVSSLFRIKDSTPFVLRSKVVYCYKCAGCDASYIRKTSQHHTRICEHLGISAITSRLLKSPVFSAIREHNFSVRPSAESFTILTSGISDIDILTREALLIKELKQSLNGNVRQLELILY